MNESVRTAHNQRRRIESSESKAAKFMHLNEHGIHSRCSRLAKGGFFMYPMMQRNTTILSIFRCHVTSHFKMDSLRETSHQAAVFANSSLLYVHCVDFDYKFDLTVPSLPFLKFNGVFGHVSLVGSLSERRIVVFRDSEDVLGKLRGKRSPCVVTVTSSVVFKLLPDEVEDERDAEVLLVWGFELEEAMSENAHAVEPGVVKHGEKDGFSFMPPLDLVAVNCNCSRFPAAGVVCELPTMEGATRMVDSLHLSDEENDNRSTFSETGDVSDGHEDNQYVDNRQLQEQQQQQRDGTLDNTLYSELKSLKGSSFHKHFQGTLKQCKLLMANKSEVNVRLHPEPTNSRDENAIVVQVYVDSSWKPIAYVPGKKLKKLTAAICSQEIVGINLKNVAYQYNFAVNDFRYVAYFSITKRGKWLKNDSNYRYNQPL